MKYKLSTLLSVLVIASLGANGYRQHLELSKLQVKYAALQVESERLEKDRKRLAYYYESNQNKLLQFAEGIDARQRLILSRSTLNTD